eukprot:IDg13947t1
MHHSIPFFELAATVSRQMPSTQVQEESTPPLTTPVRRQPHNLREARTSNE